MFTGIIEALGKVVSVEKDRDNLNLIIASGISSELKIDQSLSHNGICLTITGMNPAANTHTVTAVYETILKTNLDLIKAGDILNLERCLIAGERLDGICRQKEDQQGSWVFTFDYQKNPNHLTVEKGSVCINGVSLTVINSGETEFSVAIIPYTFEHTNFRFLCPGDKVNIEFDIVGKYIRKMMPTH